MPHKIVREDVIRRLEEEIQTCNTSIKRSQSITRGDKEGFDALKDQLKDFLETAREKKDEALDYNVTNEKGEVFSAELQDRFATLCRGQEKAFSIILNLIENPNNSISYYEGHRLQVQKQLEELKKYEQRPA